MAHLRNVTNIEDRLAGKRALHKRAKRIKILHICHFILTVYLVYLAIRK